MLFLNLQKQSWNFSENSIERQVSEYSTVAMYCNTLQMQLIIKKTILTQRHRFNYSNENFVCREQTSQNFDFKLKFSSGIG